MKQVLIRLKENEPQILAEFEVENDDIIPIVGDNISISATKKGFRDAIIDFSREYKIVKRDFYLGNGNGMISIEYEAIRSDEDPD